MNGIQSGKDLEEQKLKEYHNRSMRIITVNRNSINERLDNIINNTSNVDIFSKNVMYIYSELNELINECRQLTIMREIELDNNR